MIHLGEDSKALSLFRSMRKEHTVFYTNSTTIIKSKGETYLIGPKIDFKTMGFMRKVKNYALKTDKPEVKLKRKLNYYKYTKIQDGIYNDAVEVDVNSAYWKIALKLGYINSQLYEEGLEVDKMTRLMALGGLATSKRVYQYDPQSDLYEYIETIENPVTRSYFFDVANYLDIVMSDIIKGVTSNVFFYWVDAFFLKEYMEDYVREALSTRDLECKTGLVEYIRARKISAYTQQIDVKMLSGKTKPFFRKLRKPNPNEEFLNFAARIKDMVSEGII